MKISKSREVTDRRRTGTRIFTKFLIGNSSTSLCDGQTSDGRQEETRTGIDVYLDKAEGTREDH
jgi:hypothetical protein